jgi:polyhydroxybutyrate depolymerase
MRPVGFEPLAEASGTVIAYPDALDGSWNDGRTGVDHPSNINQVDDLGFLRALIDDLTAHAGVDADRVWVVGYSNGGMMASRAACELADHLSAVALINGPGAAGLSQRCHPARPLRVLLIHSVGDPVVPYAGGAISAHNGHPRGASAPVMDVFTLWATVNHCTARAEASASDASAPEAPITRIRAVGCLAGTAVTHHRLEAATHAWPNSPAFSATPTAWNFFQGA